MAVYKSQRSEAITSYLKYAHELRLQTLRIVKKFPTSYRYVFSNNLLDLVSEIYINCLKGNSVKIDLRYDKQDFNIRHEMFLKAQAANTALIGEITFAYELLHEGNNYFEGGKAEYGKKFQAWSEIAVKCLESINKIIEEDNKRQYKREENKKQYNGKNGKKENRPKNYNKKDIEKQTETKIEEKKKDESNAI